VINFKERLFLRFVQLVIIAKQDPLFQNHVPLERWEDQLGFLSALHVLRQSIATILLVLVDQKVLLIEIYFFVNHHEIERDIVLDCPKGAYCPQNTYSMNEFLCPPGTFSNRTLLSSSEQCASCLPGYYCDSYGLLQPSGTCVAGYYCGGGSSSATPQFIANETVSYSGDMCMSGNPNIIVNGICPPGNYCPEKSAAPVPCPPGTNTSVLGLQDLSQCQPCMKGMFCPAPGTVLAIRPCVPGYFCPTGTINPISNSSLLCPVGKYCPQGSSKPEPCPLGTYQSSSGHSTCRRCPAGYFCGVFSGTINPTLCGQGNKCPSGSSEPTSCELGTYQDENDSDSCKVCPGGYFCGDISGTINPKMCPSKAYCSVESSAPIKCPPGTIGIREMLTSPDECSQCPGGRYCSDGDISGVCSAGYFCRFGASSPAPFTDTTGLSLLEASNLLSSQNFGQCPPNYYCPRNSSQPIPCRLVPLKT